MTANLEYGAGTHVGLVRNNNEDNFLAEPDLGLWLIADGMGGHDAGEVASQIVKESVAEAIRNKVPLDHAISQSHQDVKNAAEQNIGSPNMGTTIIALLSQGSDYQIAWVGDSRAYLWDPLHHNLKQLSKDHSYVQSLYDAGAITDAEMKNHAQKNVITQSLGVASLDSVDVDVIRGKWSRNQKILLCSDGLSDLVSDEEIAHIIRKHHQQGEQFVVDRLIQTALDQGGVDNVTVELISAPADIATTHMPSASKISMLKIGLGTVTALAMVLFFWALLK